jgi:hypothetical protein
VLVNVAVQNIICGEQPHKRLWLTRSPIKAFSFINLMQYGPVTGVSGHADACQDIEVAGSRLIDRHTINASLPDKAA